MKRRDFSKMAGLGLLAMNSIPSLASSHLFQNESSGSSKIPLGLCDYALRGMRMKAKATIEYAAQHKFDSVLFNSFKSFENLEPEHLSEVNELAKANNISVYIGAFSISKTSSEYRGGYENAEARLKDGIRVANAVGSPIVATRIGMEHERYQEGGIEVHIKEVIRVMKAMRGPALDAGIKFAMENHQELRSEDVLRIIHEVGPDVCGTLLDPANTICVMDDPDRAMNMLGEYIVCTSARDFMVYESEEGATMQCTAIGQGMVDYKRFTEFFTKNCPGVPIHIETIGSNKREIPFLKPDFWDGYADVPARGIVDFLNRIRHGHPVEIPEATHGMDKAKFDIMQQERMLQESVDYLRNQCGVGLKS